MTEFRANLEWLAAKSGDFSEEDAQAAAVGRT